MKCLMRLCKQFLAIALLVQVLALCPADSTSQPQSDSTQKIIDQLIQTARLKIQDPTSANLDSVVMLADSARHLALKQSDKRDTINAIADYLQSFVCISRTDDSTAELLLKHAIDTWRSVWGTACAQQSSPMRLLGDLYMGQSRYTEAEETYSSAIAILQNAPPYDGIFRTRWMLGLLHNNLANNYGRQAKFETAQSQYDSALTLWTEDTGAASPEACVALSNIAWLSYQIGDYSAAEQRYRQVLHIYEQTPREKKMWASDVSDTRGMLALVFNKQGRWQTADSLMNLALEDYVHRYGVSSPAMLSILNGAYFIAMERGNWAQAAAYIQRIVNIEEISKYPKLADYSRDQIWLARCNYNLGDSIGCLDAFEKGIFLRRSFIKGVFSYATENTKLRYVRQFPLIDDSFLSFAAGNRSGEIINSALQMVLSGKAIVLDALTIDRKAALCSGQNALSSLVKRYAAVCDSIANFSVRRADVVSQHTGDGVSTYYMMKDSLELELSQRCAEFDSPERMPAVSVAEIAGALPPRGVLWEYIWYRPFCFTRPDSVLPSRYLAFTLDAQGHTTIADLGEARVIDSLVELVHQVVQSGADVFVGEDEHRLESELNRVSSDLANLILSPLLKITENCDHIFISPDGQLSLLPFEILPLPDGRYAIEKYEFSYLSSGRDLLRFQTTQRSEASGTVVIAAPDYESAQPGVYAQISDDLDPLGVNRFRGPSDRTECLAVPFNPLPGSAAEGRTVADMLSGKFGSDVHYLSGPEASEESLKHLNHPPRILHIATHGYFCSKARYSDCMSSNKSDTLLLKLRHTLPHGNCFSVLSSPSVNGLPFGSFSLL